MSDRSEHYRFSKTVEGTKPGERCPGCKKKNRGATVGCRCGAPGGAPKIAAGVRFTAPAGTRIWRAPPRAYGVSGAAAQRFESMGKLTKPIPSAVCIYVSKTKDDQVRPELAVFFFKGEAFGVDINALQALPDEQPA